MPEEEHHEGGAKKKGVSRNTWLALGVVAGVVVYIWYKRRQSSSAAANTIATLPAGMPGGAMSSVTGAGRTTFNSLQDWMAHIQTWANSLGFDAAVTQNALQAYQGGHCLSGSQFAIIDQALTVFGAPPGAPYQGVVQCTPTPTPPPPTTVPNQYVAGQLVNPQSGETIVQSLFDPVLGEWLNLTSHGGIYTSGGNKLLGKGSYLGYAAGTPNPGVEIALHGNFGPGGLAINPDGSYKLTNTNGETYNFPQATVHATA